jgi:integrase
MPIQKTEAGGYEVRVCVRGQRAHRRLPPGTPAGDAKRIESELRLALERAPRATRSVVIPGNPSMVEILGLYTEEAEHSRSPATNKNHAARVMLWAEKYRAADARACTAHFVKDMRGRYKPGTINRSLGCLRRGLQMAWERGFTRENYADAVKSLPDHNARETHLSVDEVRKLASHASKNVEAAIWIALLTGCRRGEVCQIAAGDIGADSILIRAGNTKTLKTRTVPIFPALRPWLGYLPLAINFEGLKSGFRRARVAAGMKHVQYRDLRRSCGMILLSLDTPLDVIRDVLGHASIKTTETHYAHAIIARQRAAMERLGALTETKAG